MSTSNGLISRVCGGCQHGAAPAPAKAVPGAAELCPDARTGSSCQNGKARDVPLRLTQRFGPVAAPHCPSPAQWDVPVPSGPAPLPAQTFPAGSSL